MQQETNQKPRVLFLYNNERSTVYQEVLEGKNHGVGFWGMIHLRNEGFETHFLEPENVYPKWLATIIRRRVNVYLIHVLFFFRIFKYDAIFSSVGFGLQFFYTLYPFKKPKWIMHDFNITNLIGDRKTIKQRMVYWMVSKCDGIVTLGEEETEALKKMFPHLADRIQLIPFGVDVDIFSPPEMKERDNVIIGVGRDPDRDWDLLVSAAPEIKAQVLIATREHRVAHLRPLPENVESKHYALDELNTALDRAKIFVLPMDTSNKTNETMGCSALYEAMAKGKAVVSTHTKTVASYIEHGQNGFMIADGDREGLIKCVNLLLKDDQLRLGFEKQAREYAEAKLDIHIVTADLAAFLRKVIYQNITMQETSLQLFGSKK